MAKKKTKAELFTEMLACDEVVANPEWKALIENEIALLVKANSNRKPTKTQVENERLAEVVIAEFERLADMGFITQKEFHSATTVAEIKEMTPQKLAPILNKLVAKNLLIKVDNSKGATYAVATA
jgi:hypothetical protein